MHEPARRDRLLAHVLHRDRHRALGRERRASGDHLVEDDAERVHVGAAVDLEALRLLRGEVRRGADDGTRRGEPGAGVGGVRGDAEVGDLHLALRREQHVPRLDVAVHDAVAVREVESGGDLGADPRRVHRREPALGPEEVAERLALDVLHDDEVRAVVLAVVVDADDVGVVEHRRVLRLTAEPLDEARIARELGEQHLDRDESIELLIASEEDIRHATARDRPFDRVSVREDVGDLRHRLLTVPRGPRNSLAERVCGAIIPAASRPSAVASTFAAIGAATAPPVASLPRLPPRSTITDTATCGFSAGANAMNHACGGPPSACAVPVLPATVTPGI